MVSQSHLMVDNNQRRLIICFGGENRFGVSVLDGRRMFPVSGKEEKAGASKQPPRSRRRNVVPRHDGKNTSDGRKKGSLSYGGFRIAEEDEWIYFPSQRTKKW